MNKLTKVLIEHISKYPYNFKNTDNNTVLEFLYQAYADTQGADSEEIKNDFKAIDDLLGDVSLDVNNAIFTRVCNLILAYEEKAFTDGIKIGSALMLEL